MTKMLSFDSLSYLLFATIILVFTLYFSLLLRFKPIMEPKLSKYIEEKAKGWHRPTKKERKAAKQTKPLQLPKTSDTDEKECPHYVGYLTTLEKGSPFPDECFGCRKVIKCLRIEPTRVIESFYIDPENKNDATQRMPQR